jgi:hypothetical protein
VSILKYKYIVVGKLSCHLKDFPMSLTIFCTRSSLESLKNVAKKLLVIPTGDITMSIRHVLPLESLCVNLKKSKSEGKQRETKNTFLDLVQRSAMPFSDDQLHKLKISFRTIRKVFNLLREPCIRLHPCPKGHNWCPLVLFPRF